MMYPKQLKRQETRSRPVSTRTNLGSRGQGQLASPPPSIDMPCNEPFGSRPEPGINLTALFLLPPHGEVPEGRAGVHLQSIGHCA